MLIYSVLNYKSIEKPHFNNSTILTLTQCLVANVLLGALNYKKEFLDRNYLPKLYQSELQGGIIF